MLFDLKGIKGVKSINDYDLKDCFIIFIINELLY